MTHPTDPNSPRTWVRARPDSRAVIVNHDYCPWCRTYLDKDTAINDKAVCSCGQWSYSLRPSDEGESGWYFRRAFNSTEREEQRQNRIALLREELEALGGL